MMISEMQIRNYSLRTIKTYVSMLSGLSRYYKISPDQLTTQQLKDFLAYRVQQQHVSVSTVNQIIGAWRLLQVDVLNRKWEEFQIKRPIKEKKLPHVLSRKEALKLIYVLPNVKHRTLLTLAYTTGLRRSELLDLKPEHIDGDQHHLRVVAGKGHKQRLVPVSDTILTMLRDYYKSYLPITYLFEGQQPGQKYSETSFANITKRAARVAGIKKKVSPHILRHSFASHMLEKGVNLKKLQLMLGHNSMRTTTIYLHVTNTDAPVPDLLCTQTKDES